MWNTRAYIYLLLFTRMDVRLHGACNKKKPDLIWIIMNKNTVLLLWLLLWNINNSKNNYNLYYYINKNSNQTEHILCTDIIKVVFFLFYYKAKNKSTISLCSENVLCLTLLLQFSFFSFLFLFLFFALRQNPAIVENLWPIKFEGGYPGFGM